jgi:hypothetical protein
MADRQVEMGRHLEKRGELAGTAATEYREPTVVTFPQQTEGGVGG